MILFIFRFDGHNTMMHYSLHITKYLLKGGIMYKYLCINKPVLNGVFHHFEFIETEQGNANVNRYLLDKSPKGICIFTVSL